MQVYVGEFNLNDLINGRDKIEVEKKQKETELKYTNTELVYKGKKAIGIKIWVCDLESLKI